MTTTSNMPNAGKGAGAEREIHPLSKVTRAVGRMLDERAGGKLFWVRAEISQCSFSGKHAYLDLVEEKEGQRMAQLRGTIWGSRLVELRKSLGKEFDEVLKPGREIVFSAHMAFHAVYGFSLNIQEIDLDVLLGEMERRRKAALASLQKEGAIGRNGRLKLATVPQRLVLIGSEGTAGYTDFMEHLKHNEWGYRFDIGRIDVPVQGAHAAQALVQALHLAGRVGLRNAVDAVVVLRGGGAKLDLDVFNDLTLCRTMAAMEVPVVVGIGHETDQTLVDFVAHTACKTPTAVADFLIGDLLEFEAGMAREGRAVAAESKAILREQKGGLDRFDTLIRERPLSVVRGMRGELHASGNLAVRRTREALFDRHAGLDRLRNLLRSGVGVHASVRMQALGELERQMRREAARHLRQHEQRMGSIKDTLALLGPEPTLQRGFSITRKDGGALKTPADLKPGDNLETQLAEGSVRSVVTSIEITSKGQS